MRISRIRRGVSGSAVAAAAMAALTASQASDVFSQDSSPPPEPAERSSAEEPDQEPGQAPVELPYHTDLPPLDGVEPDEDREDGQGGGSPLPDEAGIPATVLDAYRSAAARLAETDPGCRLDWEVLAAIGKVESGHARGGDVTADGTTVSPILGPVLNGDGFANISDTDGGAYDGDARYDRAVGPMQFIPSTWASWGTDGNGDGTADPNNVYDAALAAGLYLCANDRDLSNSDDLDQALLSYNRSWDYVRTVRSWLDYYRDGAHEVPDGEGSLPGSPGPGNPDDSGRPDERPDRGEPRPQRPGQGDEADPRPPAESDGEVRPTDPDEQQPEDPEEPEEPEEPGGEDPEDPGEDPDDPGEPGEPGEPQCPEDPEEPGDPDDPGEQPDEPGEPGEDDGTGTPEDPETPDEPGQSGEGDEGDEGEDGEEPGEGEECPDPDDPQDPDEPDNPDEPDSPDEPGEGDENGTDDSEADGSPQQAAPTPATRRAL
ncbi:hypothetical protein FH609_007455 [Streptomyces sp. 3MP-14]|uniref:Uncharacterized protein n=1 Tax=Streptomyces mimosae TaxID=2586635 RepID=A0A5N6AJR3_9ACTN|nr:hypothetical protein FH607_005910 [Streptomyces mimosae]KAB8178230.1 hypothetical protein FH609_007455 [Streptomyces sp. 3MP-14]